MRCSLSGHPAARPGWRESLATGGSPTFPGFPLPALWLSGVGRALVPVTLVLAREYISLLTWTGPRPEGLLTHLPVQRQKVESGPFFLSSASQDRRGGRGLQPALVSALNPLSGVSSSSVWLCWAPAPQCAFLLPSSLHHFHLLRVQTSFRVSPDLLRVVFNALEVT